MLLWPCCGSRETTGSRLLSPFSSFTGSLLLGDVCETRELQSDENRCIAWWVVSGGSEGLHGALTTACAPYMLSSRVFSHTPVLGGAAVFQVALGPPQVQHQLRALSVLPDSSFTTPVTFILLLLRTNQCFPLLEPAFLAT